MTLKIGSDNGFLSVDYSDMTNYCENAILSDKIKNASGIALHITTNCASTNYSTTIRPNQEVSGSKCSFYVQLKVSNWISNQYARPSQRRGHRPNRRCLT